MPICPFQCPYQYPIPIPVPIPPLDLDTEEAASIDDDEKKMRNYKMFLMLVTSLPFVSHVNLGTQSYPTFGCV